MDTPLAMTQFFAHMIRSLTSSFQIDIYVIFFSSQILSLCCKTIYFGLSNNYSSQNIHILWREPLKFTWTYVLLQNSHYFSLSV